MGDTTETRGKIIVDNLDESTTLLTYSDRIAANQYRQAMAAYDPSNNFYSAYLNDSSTSSTVTVSSLIELGTDAQTSLDNLRTINGIIRKYINTDDIVGMVVQSIANNINTSMRKSFKNFNGQRNKTKTLEKAKAVLNDFDNQVRIETFIRDAILTAYIEGNYAAVLRNSNENWQIDWLPLHIIENSGYENNGNPVILVNIENLKNALNKTMIKNKKGQFLFFKNT